MTEQVTLLVAFDDGAQGYAYGETPRDFSPDDARIVLADDYREHDDYSQLTVMLDMQSMDWLGSMSKLHGEPRAFVVHAPELPQSKIGENKTDGKPSIRFEFDTGPLLQVHESTTRAWIHGAAIKAVQSFNGIVDLHTLTHLYTQIADRCGYSPERMTREVSDMIVDEASEAFDVLTGKRAIVDGKFVLQYDYAEAEKRIAASIPMVETDDPVYTYRSGRYRQEHYDTVAGRGTMTGRWTGRKIGMVPELGAPYQPQWINPARKVPEPVVTHMHVHGVADAETFKNSAEQIAQYLSRVRHPEHRAIFVSPIHGSIDEEMLRRLQSKQTVHEALCDGDFAEDTSEDASDGGAIGGGAYGGRDGGEADDRRVGEGAHGEFESVQPSEEPAWETCAGNHQGRHTILPQACPSLGQEGGRSAMTLETKIVKVGSGYSVQLVQQGDQWQSGPKPDGSGWGNHALLTAPEMDALIAKLCKARDEVRRKNRPHHGIGTWRV